MIRHHTLLKAAFVLIASVSVLVRPATSFRAAEALPFRISDDAFWQMVSDFSEEDGYFRFENFLSNEQAFQFVIPALKETTKPGGVYMGVGPEQNFTYLVALRPKIAFIIDIRRQNMLEHMMYKAVFEMSSDRAEFLSRLFARKRPSGLSAESTAEELFDASSTFIRSVNGGNYYRPQGFGMRFLSVLSPMTDMINAFNEGRIRSYYDVIQMSK